VTELVNRAYLPQHASVIGIGEESHCPPRQQAANRQDEPGDREPGVRAGQRPYYAEGNGQPEYGSLVEQDQVEGTKDEERPRSSQRRVATGLTARVRSRGTKGWNP
jgi:hypothetical protein